MQVIITICSHNNVYCTHFFKIKNFKGAVSLDFLTFFITRIEAIWAPDKQAKMVLFKSLFLQSWTLRRLTLRGVGN